MLPSPPSPSGGSPGKGCRAGRKDGGQGSLGPEAGPGGRPGREEDVSVSVADAGHRACGGRARGWFLRGSAGGAGPAETEGSAAACGVSWGSWAEGRGLQPAPGSSSSGSRAPAGILSLLPSGWELAWAVP